MESSIGSRCKFVDVGLTARPRRHAETGTRHQHVGNTHDRPRTLPEPQEQARRFSLVAIRFVLECRAISAFLLSQNGRFVSSDQYITSCQLRKPGSGLQCSKIGAHELEVSVLHVQVKILSSRTVLLPCSEPIEVM